MQNIARAPPHRVRTPLAEQHLAVVKFVGIGQEATVTWVSRADFGILLWILHLEPPAERPWGLERNITAEQMQ